MSCTCNLRRVRKSKPKTARRIRVRLEEISLERENHRDCPPGGAGCGIAGGKRRSRRRRSQVADRMCRSWKYAALQPEGRGLREQDRTGDRVRPGDRRAVLLAALDRARTDAHDL